MSDLERWKDKVELSLDGRQIFFLFFGSAIAACLIFVVGVLIGKRMEARAQALTPAPVEDPLAALDQLGDAEETDGLTFHRALTRQAGAHEAVEPEAKAEAKAEPKAEAKAEPKAEAKADSRPEARIDVKPDVKAEPKPETKPEAKLVAKVEVKAPRPSPPPDGAKKGEPDPRPLPKLEPQTVARPSADGKPSSDGKGERLVDLPRLRPDARAADARPPLATRPQVVAQGKKPDAAGKKPDGPGHFTLQLSAFPDKADAEEFMRKIQSAGYRPSVVATEIPGKGLFYRVRVGDYATRQGALDAKTEFERKQRLIAYVARL
jgi:cell division protein FtsN